MELNLKKITMDAFRGVQHKEIEFDGDTKIKGSNGSGKSTVMSAFMWVMADADSKLVKNPVVVPIGSEECTPTVEIEFELDGKPLTVCKQQKYKTKNDDGKITSTSTNSYSINGVEKTLKVFTEDLSERGIDMENLLYICHPDSFTADTSAKGREKIRTVLFGMIDDISDTAIAKDLDTPELYALLEEKGLKVEEVESMAKSSLRKINEKYGKSNEILDGRIQGIIQSKSQVNVEEINKLKTQYEKELDQVRDDYKNLRKNDSNIEAKIAELEGKCDDLERAETRKLEEEKAALSEKLREAEQKYTDINYEMAATKNAADRILQDSEGVKESLEHYREIYKKTQAETFDKESLKCPTCGRSFPKEEAEKIKKDFEESKTKRLADYKKMGEMFRIQYEAMKGEYEDKIAEYNKKHDEWAIADEQTSKLMEQYRAMPVRPNLDENEEHKKIRNKIEELRNSLGQNDADKTKELSEREDQLIEKIKQADAELTLVERNKELDQQIENLRAEKKEAEIQRAKNEQIIDQVKTFVQAKNDLLTSKINEKFSMVEWHLYEYQKNGEIKPVCEPYIDDKPISSAANGSLNTLAKISICADLQKYFNQIVPIWVEDYSLFSNNTESRINVDSQIIGLVVTEDKELLIEKR